MLPVPCNQSCSPPRRSQARRRQAEQWGRSPLRTGRGDLGDGPLSEGPIMTCPKCCAQMLLDRPVRYFASADANLMDTSDTRSHCPSYRCPCCATYLDPVILENRAKQANTIAIFAGLRSTQAA